MSNNAVIAANIKFLLAAFIVGFILNPFFWGMHHSHVPEIIYERPVLVYFFCGLASMFGATLPAFAFFHRKLDGIRCF